MNAEDLMIEVSEKMKPKLCVGCKHFKLGLFWRLINRMDYGQCGHPRFEPIRGPYFLIDGKADDPKPYCVSERMHLEMQNVCGPEGKYWEKK